MNLRYFHKLLGHKTDPSSGERSRGGRIEGALGSVKMKNFSFGVFNYKTELFKQIGHYIITIKKTTV